MNKLNKIDEAVIKQQIKNIFEIEKFSESETFIYDILYKLLKLSIKYNLISIDEKDIIKEFKILNKHYIIESLKLLCERKILIKTIEKNVNYYNLNYKYLNENAI